MATFVMAVAVPIIGWQTGLGKGKELVANSGRQRLNIHGALNAEAHEFISHRVESVNAQRLSTN